MIVLKIWQIRLIKHFQNSAAQAHGKELSGYAPPEWPQCVVWPTSTEEVSSIVKVPKLDKK